MICYTERAMRIEVQESPNCQGSEQFVFNELGRSRPVAAIRVDRDGREELCDVIGVGRAGAWLKAQCVKVADSSDGHAFLIHGGDWGIRLKPRSLSNEPWGFEARDQWGEPFKVYGSEDDIIYAND